MQKAIEILEAAAKDELSHRDGYHSILNLGGSTWQEVVVANLPENRIIIAELKEMDSDIEQLQSAINHLKRKAKKDPRVDGLPESGKDLLLWMEWGVTTGHYAADYKHWATDMDYHPTDETLFYCDPDEII